MADKFYRRDRRDFYSQAAVEVTEAQFRQALTQHMWGDLDSVMRAMTSATNWIRMPVTDFWVAPDTTFGPTMLNRHASISDCKTMEKLWGALMSGRRG